MISEALITIAVQELPETLAAFRFAFLEAFPTEPPPEDTDIIAALIAAHALITGPVPTRP